jgi:predicted Zn-dependent peptidase
VSTFKHAKLPNNLDVIAEVMPTTKTAAIGFMVKTGARDEVPDVSGVSHFLEHMMFKGTARRTAADINREFDSLGARNNAFTSNEVTCYWAQILPEYLAPALDILADMMRPALRVEDFDMEKNVILEEISLYLDKPGHILYERIMEDHFGSHPLANSILGSKESITALTQQQMRDYFDRHYGPGNMVLAAAGQIDFDELVELAHRACGQWPSLAVQRRYPAVAPAARRHHIRDEKLKRHYLGTLCPGPTSQDMDRFSAAILADVVGDHDGSRLFWSLIEPGLAEEADFSTFMHDGLGSFFGYASCDPAKAALVEETMIKELSHVRDDGVTEDEIARSKTKIATSTVLSGELPLGRMRNLCSQWIYNREFRTLEEDLAELEKVSTQSIKLLLSKYPLSPLTITTLGPGDN